MNRLLKFFLGFLVVVLIGAAIAYFAIWNVPKVSAKTQSADMTVTAEQLFSDYQQDQGAGDKLYIGKVLEVSGTITEISSDEQGAPVVLFGTDDAFGGVLCTFELGEKDKISALQPGQKARVKGICTGMLMEVVLNRCTLLD